jgi:hypothetical protein
MSCTAQRRVLVSGSEEGIKLWAVPRGGEVTSSSNNPAMQNRLLQRIDSDGTRETHESAVQCAHWFMDGQFLATVRQPPVPSMLWGRMLRPAETV